MSKKSIYGWLLGLVAVVFLGEKCKAELPLLSYDGGEAWAGVSLIDPSGEYVKVRKERAGESADWLTITDGKFWTPVDSIVLAKADGMGVNLLVDFKSLPDNDATLTVGSVSVINGKTYQQFTFLYADGDTLTPRAEIKSYNVASVPEPSTLGMALVGVVAMFRRKR